MGHVSDFILPAVAGMISKNALGNNTKPTEDQVLGWCDESIRDIIRHSLPRLDLVGVMTPGRLDLINKITVKTVDTGASGGNSTPPGATQRAVAFLTILVGYFDGESTTNYYPTKESGYDDFLNAALDAIYTPAATEPIYTWADGKVKYLPTSRNRVDYHYIAMPAKLTNASNWPVNVGTLPLGLFYVLAEMADQAGEMTRGQIWRKFYEHKMERLTGMSYKIHELWGR